MEDVQLRNRSENVSTKSKSKSDDFPQTYIILQFVNSIHSEAVQWIIYKIQSERKFGGAEFLVRKQPNLQVEEEPLIFHISATDDKLLDLAEEQNIRKRDLKGELHDVTMSDYSDFGNRGDILSTAEKEYLVRHELENIRALENEKSVPGYPRIPLYEGQSIFSACIHFNLLQQMFPLHDEEALRKLGHKCLAMDEKPARIIYIPWCLLLDSLYFTAAYFTYLHLVRLTSGAFKPLTLGDWKFLILLSGIICRIAMKLYKLFITRSGGLMLLLYIIVLGNHAKGLLTLGWLAVIFKPWYKLGQCFFEEVREYFGESIALYFQFLGFYSNALIVPMLLGFIQLCLAPENIAIFCIINILWASIFLEMYAVSLPLVVVCMAVAFVVMLVSFWLEEQLRATPDCPHWLVITPSVVYAGLICLMNMAYRRFANYLTEWENHRTQSQFDRHRVTKLVLFEFVNNFMSLFYIAFIYQDMDMLRSQLATLLIISQVINNFQEALLPLILQYYSSQVAKLKKNGQKRRPVAATVPDVLELQEDDPRVAQALRESGLDPYEDPYDDYLELFVQFGYVILFSSVYPMAAFWAVANNFLEIRSDAFKLCRSYQRPMARRVKDTGAWQRAFQALSTLSVMTNCGFLYLSPALRAATPAASPAEWLMVFVCLEHVLLAVRQILHCAIPDKPDWVRLALARHHYQSKLALKMQRLERTT